jgi:hypothetical protein
MSVQSISRRAAWLALLLAALAGAPAAATSYVMVSDEALVATAPLAVVGRIVSVDRSMVLHTAHGPALTTGYGVEVEERLKGTAPAGVLPVRVPGGMGRDGIGLEVYGAPRFRVGERVLLFLEPDPRGGVPGGLGGYRLVHFLLGAFHEVAAGSRSFAVRNLREASELRVTAAGLEEVAPRGRDALRDFAGFARWVKARAAGAAAPPGYLVADPDGSLRGRLGKYSLFEDPVDHHNLRWFVFDSGGNVPWKAHVIGQVGLTGGGYSEFKTALAAWNAEPETPIDYRYAGTTASTNGLGFPDGINSIVFNDPTDILPAFDCSTGGVLSLGGPWYEQALTEHQGGLYHRIVSADVVVNDGIGCFFARSHSPSKAAQELFAHELGHTLGLGHACGDPGGVDPSCADPQLNDALMRRVVHDDGRGARLGGDDHAGIQALYRLGGDLPAAPAGLAAVAVSTGKIHLTWQDRATNETEYRVELKVLGGGYFDIGGVPADSTEVDVDGLSPATGYGFRVRARNVSGFSGYSNEVIAATFAPIAPCVADGRTLCLNHGRFRAEVDWKTPDGLTGAGSVVLTSDTSGLLWFFDPGNFEVIVKVLNGCAESTPRYWVLLAGATSVQYTVTVTDTQTGAVKVYFYPLNHSAAAVAETGAFTCP